MQKLGRRAHNAGGDNGDRLSTGVDRLGKMGNLLHASLQPQTTQVLQVPEVRASPSKLHPARQMRHMCGSSRDTGLHKQTQEWGNNVSQRPKLQGSTPRLEQELHGQTGTGRRAKTGSKELNGFPQTGPSDYLNVGKYEPPQTRTSRNVDVGLHSASKSTRHTSQHRSPCPRASSTVGKEQKPPPRKNCRPTKNDAQPANTHAPTPPPLHQR
ncbi:hypothetical protein GWK47_005183 [Chionoecetes opilio]|uniref:Uncharacterized protein n=1 Tax=Chionoecetes opilio TaxID=41210 RepID=A0A8J4YAF4_CHIOP|nr:hypothetical protein GWK47_005183 [Chionoecetes opilio]